MAIFRRPVSARRSIKKRKATYAKKTLYRPRKGAGGPVTGGVISGLSNNNYGFPDKISTKLQYSDVVQLQASAGTPGLWQFRMNSLFDPDFTGTGHQPKWFDQLAAVYFRYRVKGAKITAKFIPNQIADAEANDRGPYIVGITTSASSGFGASNYAALLENPNTTSAIVVDKQGANNMKELCATYSPKRDLDLDPMDAALQSDVTTNPGTGFFATVWALDMSELAAQDVACQIDIEFSVEFSRIRDNVNS